MEQTSTEKMRELVAKLNQWRHEYFVLNAPTVSDAIYDRHFDELERLEQQTDILMSNSPTNTVGYEVVDGLEKTTHTIPLLSLDKTKNVSDLMRFIGSQQVLLMHKLDGLTVKLEYENGLLIRASTRGNGEEGEVITHNARAIDGIPAWIPYLERLVVVGEVYITKPTFERLQDTLRDSSGNSYKNARTDGACQNNPGPGGYGAILICGSYRKEISGGNQDTTNNRMEIMGAIVALEMLKSACEVEIYSDSRYLVDAIEKGWVIRWKANGWRRKKAPALNVDLWERLLPLLSKHKVKFRWMKGHSGHPENERCDLLARTAIAKL